MNSSTRQTSPSFDAHSEVRKYPQAQGNLTADVVVIGGGLVGMIAAWRLARAGTNVILLEKNHLASGDTGFTTSFFTRVPDAHLSRLDLTYGRAYVKKLFDAARAVQDDLRALIAQEHIACDLVPCSSYHGSYKEDDHELRHEWAVARHLNTGAELILSTEAKERGLPFAAAIMYPQEARFDARAFVLELASRLDKKNVRIFEESEAFLVERRGNTVHAQTQSASVEARKVIIATGLPSPIRSDIEKTLTPMVTYAINVHTQHMPISDNLFWDTDRPYHYFRRLDAENVILGGSDRRADRAGTGKEHEKLESFFHHKFPYAYRVTHAWSGSIFSTPDELPIIDAEPGSDGRIIVATGFSGNGMVMGGLGGIVAAHRALNLPHPATELLSIKRGQSRAPTLRALQQAYPLKIFLRWAVSFAYTALLVLLPYTFFSMRGGPDVLSGAELQTATQLLFPLLGLIAYYLVWTQILIGPHIVWWQKLFPRIERFHRIQGVVAFSFAVLHPSFILISVGVSEYLQFSFVSERLKPYAIIGEIQLALLTLAVIAALLRNQPWLAKHWRKIHYANYAVFILAFIHSWNLGSDIQTSGLSYLWFAIGATGAASIILRLWRAARPALIRLLPKRMVPLMKTNEIAAGKPICAEVHGKKIAVFAVDGKYFAIDNTCTHAGGSLCRGLLNGHIIQCPLHRARYDITTGKVVAGPARIDVVSYPTRVRNGMLEIGL